jgi:hypothetical protein
MSVGWVLEGVPAEWCGENEQESRQDHQAEGGLPKRRHFSTPRLLVDE